MSAQAEPLKIEKDYLDLIFGHCMQSVHGRSLRPIVGTAPSEWVAVEDYEGSESSMNTPEARAEVDLRSRESEEGALLVDLQNEEICWTQATVADPGALAARVRLFVMDHELGGVLLGEAIEPNEAGGGSRLTTLALSDWSETIVPIVMIREILMPPSQSVTVQVMTGEKSPNGPKSTQ